MSAAAAGRSRGRLFLLLLVAIAALAAFVRAPGLSRPLWLDEANSVLIAERGLAGIVDALSRDGNPPLFYFLLRGWTAILGSGEIAVRALPALFGVALVPLAWRLARALFPARPETPALAAALVALSPLAVYYSQEARMYTLAPLLGGLHLLFLHAALERGRARDFALASLFLALGLYTHNFFLFVAPAGPACALLGPGALARRRALAGSIAVAGAAALAYAPWVEILLRQSASGVGAWIEPFWFATPPAAAIPRSLEVMGPGGAYPEYLLEIGTLSSVVPIEALWLAARILGAALVALSIVAGARAALRSEDERPAAARLLVFLFLPLFLPWVASFALKPIYLVGRYEMVAFMAFAAIAARGLAALPRRLAIGAGALWLALNALVLGAYHAHAPLDRERSLAEWIREVAKPPDVFVFPGYTRTVPEYYLRRWGVDTGRRSFPGAVEEHLGWFDYDAAASDMGATAEEARDLARSLAPVLARGGRVFLVTEYAPEPAIAAVCEALRTALVAELGTPMGLGEAPAGRRAPVEVFRRS